MSEGERERGSERGSEGVRTHNVSPRTPSLSALRFSPSHSSLRLDFLVLTFSFKGVSFSLLLPFILSALEYFFMLALYL